MCGSTFYLIGYVLLTPAHPALDGMCNQYCGSGWREALLFANMALCGQRLPTGSPCSAHACSCGMTRLVRAPMVKFLSIAPKRHRHFWHSADVQRVHEVQLPCRSAFHCVR